MEKIILQGKALEAFKELIETFLVVEDRWELEEGLSKSMKKLVKASKEIAEICKRILIEYGAEIETFDDLLKAIEKGWY